MRVGFVGWRGMVGSVLMERMAAEGDFEGLEATFFSTSEVGGIAPQGRSARPLQDAYDLAALEQLDTVLTCQGGDYTERVYAALRERGWRGFWIDAASTLRMHEEAVIVLDPVNLDVIEQALTQGRRTFVGGNCTVSLMLMAMGGLFKAGLVEWITTMTYQAASGAGAQNMLELVRQMGVLSERSQPLLGAGATALEVDRLVTSTLRSDEVPTAAFGAALAGSLLPWIDRDMGDGQTREEWKGQAETNKILGLEPPIPIDGLCVRVPVMRCHSQALTVKLTRAATLEEIESLLAGANDWVQVVPNRRADTLERLTPAAVSGTLTVPVGRLRKLSLGPEYLGAFTLGDQLLWGAAEPLRRMLLLLRQQAATGTVR